MGTWGDDPFDSDGADDFLDRLDRLTPAERLAEITRLLRSAAIPVSEWPSDVWDTEVVAAAAVLAASALGKDLFDADQDISRWLPKPLPTELFGLAIRALDEATAPDGPWARSWTTDESRAGAIGAIARVRKVLAGKDR